MCVFLHKISFFRAAYKQKRSDTYYKQSEFSTRRANRVGAYSAIYKGDKMMILDRISLILTIVGALNWGSIGLFQFDIVAWICGGQSSLLSRIIYTVVGLAGVWCISLLFRARETFDKIED